MKNQFLKDEYKGMKFKEHIGRFEKELAPLTLGHPLIICFLVITVNIIIFVPMVILKVLLALTILKVLFIMHLWGHLIDKNDFLTQKKYLDEVFGNMFEVSNFLQRDKILSEVVIYFSYCYFQNSAYGEETLNAKKQKQVLSEIYENKEKYAYIINEIDRWIKSIEKTHDSGLIYTIDKDDLLYEINDMVFKLADKLDLRKKEEQEIENELNQLKSLISEYDDVLQTYYRLLSQHSQHHYEHQFKVKTFILPNRNDLMKTSKNERMVIIKNIENEINKEMDAIKRYNSDVFKKVKKELKA